jgi:hypothetical protein
MEACQVIESQSAVHIEVRALAPCPKAISNNLAFRKHFYTGPTIGHLTCVTSKTLTKFLYSTSEFGIPLPYCPSKLNDVSRLHAEFAY